MSPPTTAPAGLSRPPSTAATKPNTTTESMYAGCTRPPPAISRPASEPTTEASAQPSVSIRPTRTPSSRDTSWLNAAARIRRPTSVNLNSATRSAITTSTARIVKMLVAVSAMVESPTSMPRTPKGAGKDWKRLPQTTEAIECSTMKSPSVRITALMSALPSTGRMTRRSITAPSTRPQISASAKPSQ